MRIQTTSVTGVTASAPLMLDAYATGALATVFLDLGAGCTASVEITPDDVQDPSVTPKWYPVPVAALTGATTDLCAALGVQGRAIRLNQTVGAALSLMKLVAHGII